ncbi:MAG: immunoglobulin domain-containing protein [Chloroflexi bacterium]|nr:immunoglobulin domain-containing protein [Chloroflexota bacterium]
MKPRLQLSLALLAWLCLAGLGRAAVLVDDTWTDGSRAEQNLPAESAWFTTSAANMTASPGSLSVANLATSSSQWTTYFTEAGSPSQLNVGDTLTVTIEFTPSQVAAQNSSQNWRIALCDSSAGVRLAGDGGPNAANYTGYALFGNFGQTWGRGTGIDLRRRTNLANSGLLTTSGDWASLGAGGTVTGDPAFSDGVPYTLTISVTRDSEASVTLTVAYSGGDLSSTWTATDVNTDTMSIYTKFDSVIFRPSRGDGTAMSFVFARFKVEGPGPLPPPPSLVVEPQDRTVSVAETASLSVAASGGAPLQYQWYFNDVNTPVADATTAALLLTNIQTNQAGGYFVIVSNDQGAATSRVAMVTVDLPVFTSPGPVVDDIWEDGDRGIGNPAISTNNSLWYASSATSLSASVGSMIGVPAPDTSRLWVGYFTEDPAAPVDIAVGNALKATLMFTPSNVAAQNTGSIRLGLLNYTWGTRLFADDFGTGSTGNGINVRGYMLTLNFGDSFGDNTPLEIHVRNNLGSADLMGNSGDYLSLGAGAGGSLNAPAFAGGTEYTLEFTVRRTAESAVDIMARVTGGGVDVSHTVTDSTYVYRRLDTFALRANRTTDSAEQFDIARFKVEVLPALTTPISFSEVTRSVDGSVSLTFNGSSGQNYRLWASADVTLQPVTTAWTLLSSGTFSDTPVVFTDPAAANSRRFYVLSSP